MTAGAVAPPDTVDHPSYQEFARVVRTVIAPRAVEVDATEVPLSHVDALRETGFFSWAVPVEFGGTAVPAKIRQQASDLLFGACPSTALAVTQHGAPVAQALKVGSPEALALLPKLATGEHIGTTGWSQIRTWQQRRTTFATRVSGGYEFSGLVTYLSGYGIADIGNIGAVDTATRTLVFGIVDLTQPGVTGEVLEIAGVRGSRTAAVQLDRVFVPDHFISEVVDVDEWIANDGGEQQHTRAESEATPPFVAGPVGLARAALTDALSLFPDEPSLLALSAELEYAAATPLPGVAWRAQLDEIAVRSTIAALVAHGGRGLTWNNIAQVRARAALFLQVRGLSAPMRTQRFAALARRTAVPHA